MTGYGTCCRAQGLEAFGTDTPYLLSFWCWSTAVAATTRISLLASHVWHLAEYFRISSRSRSHESQQLDGCNFGASPRVWVTAADAVWAYLPGGLSASGHLTLAAHPNMLKGRDRACVCVGLEFSGHLPSGAKFSRLVRRLGESRSVRKLFAGHGRDLRQQLQEPCRYSPQCRCSCKQSVRRLQARD